MKYILTLLSFLVFNVTASSSNLSDNLDSTKIQSTINQFYDWYINAIKDRRYSEFQPRFTKSIDGMTTLDLKEYKSNLRKYGFDDSLIDSESQSYQECIKHLSEVPYSDFKKTKFVDLYEYEVSECDFTNYYRWIGGQEICDGIEIQNIEFINDRATVLLKKYDLRNDQSRMYWNYSIKVELRNNKGNWTIESIN